MLVSNEQEYIILCGDFNIALNATLDAYNYTNVNNPSERKTLLQMMATFNLNDVFHHLHDIMLELIHKCDIRPGYRSDHSIVELQLIFFKFERGKGTWKLNFHCLSNKNI